MRIMTMFLGIVSYLIDDFQRYTSHMFTNSHNLVYVGEITTIFGTTCIGRDLCYEMLPIKSMKPTSACTVNRKP